MVDGARKYEDGYRQERLVVRRANGTTLFINTFLDRSDEDQNRFMDLCTDEMCATSQPFALIQDMRLLTKMSPVQRTHYAQCRARLREVYSQYKVMTVYVVTQDRQRGYLTAIGWNTAPSASSGRHFAHSVAAARSLCEEALDRRVATKD